jgi:hypothetical protein
MTVFESMQEFLKEQEGDPFNILPRVQKVLSIKLKDCDDDYGPIGKHYVVKCKMLLKTTAYTKENTMTKGKVYEATCLVDVREFDKFRSAKNKVIWL